jgi:hypothetical protein
LYNTLTPLADFISKQGIPFGYSDISERRILTLAKKAAKSLTDIPFKDYSDIIKNLLQLCNDYIPFIFQENGVLNLSPEAFTLIEELSETDIVNSYARAIKLFLVGEQTQVAVRNSIRNIQDGRLHLKLAKSANSKSVWANDAYEKKYFLILCLKSNPYCNIYCCETRLCSQIAYIAVTKNIAVKDAIRYVTSNNNSLFLNGVSLQTENYLSRWLFCENLSMENPEFFKEDFYLLKDKANFYNSILYPKMLNIQDQIASILQAEWLKYFGRKFPDEVFVIHIAPHRVGLAVQKDIDITRVFPQNWRLLKPVQDIPFIEMIEGRWNY